MPTSRKRNRLIKKFKSKKSVETTDPEMHPRSQVETSSEPSRPPTASNTLTVSSPAATQASLASSGHNPFEREQYILDGQSTTNFSFAPSHVQQPSSSSHSQQLSVSTYSQDIETSAVPPDLILPTPLPPPTTEPEFNEKHYEQDIESHPPPAKHTKDEEKQDHEERSQLSHMPRRWDSSGGGTAGFVRECPTDEEKYCYLHTNRIPLYIFGIFAFFSLSAGMWLFTVCDYIFAWSGLFVFLLQAYLMVSYFVGIVGRDWDFESHKQVLLSYGITAANAPTVDIYLPCCSEDLSILENTYKHVQKLDYPSNRLKLSVMDDDNKAEVKELAERYNFNNSVRTDRPRLKKAENLRWHFTRTDADFFVIYDADFCPRPDFLSELIPEHLADDKTAIIQTPQFFRVGGAQTWVEQGAGATQELFYRVVQVNRNRWGASICVGSNAVHRRAALEEVGGTAEIGFSEDVHTGFGVVNRGWKVKYIPLCLATGVCPDTPRSFFSQQMRWCMGSTTLLSNPKFWKSKLTFIQKVCYLCGFMYYSAVALSIFISPIPGILLLWFRPIYFKYYNLAFAIPLIVYGLVVFHFWAKASFGFNVQHIMVIQSYAYLTAIKDKIFGKTLIWVPTGDAKAHKSNKYRILCICCWMWTLTVLGALVGAVTYRVGFKGMVWYNTLPLIILNVYNVYLAHPFLFHT
ncbi:hypothetical protein BU16DRAFT_536336 [Lophium mytilinum]|uniref:Glycosyltransferase 2-like domain-containing protein n=1 Tax=Lophium mytilinum TaxID=390894 RepID=A0A6A6R0P5_9PEZI|nr:hypothetical protein BU16DRAFT_536336 [Lophium mytilinum]